MVIFPYVEIILCNCSCRIQASPLLLLHLLFLLSVFFFNEDVQELLKTFMKNRSCKNTTISIAVVCFLGIVFSKPNL
jgi:hypothetical protein